MRQPCIPITVTRVYDTLDAGKSRDFGYGWHLELGGYTITVDPATMGANLSGYPSFEKGTRVLVKNADGTVDGYTFDPQPGSSFGGAVFYYRPYFRPDAGVYNQLVVDQTVQLQQIADGEFIVLSDDGDNLDYNPVQFGGAYEIHQPNGMVYTVDAQTGAFRKVRDRNDNELTFGDDAITSNRGVSVTFTRDQQNRITAITDPRGHSVTYGYDANGNLLRMTDRMGEVRSEYDYRSEADFAHYLSHVYTIQNGVRIAAATPSYGTDASDPSSYRRLTGLADADGQSLSMKYDVAQQQQSVTDPTLPAGQQTSTMRFDPFGLTLGGFS